MFEISIDWVLNAAQGILAAGWGLMAWLYLRLDRRVTSLEGDRIKSQDVRQLVTDMEVVKRVLYAIAHRIGAETMAEALNNRDT